MKNKTSDAAPQQEGLVERGRRAYEDWHASLTDTPEQRALYQEGADEFDEWLKKEESNTERADKRASITKVSTSTTSARYEYSKSASTGRFVSNRTSKSQPATTYKQVDGSKKTKKK